MKMTYLCGKIVINRSSVILNPTLGRNDKIKYHIRKKINIMS